MRRNRSKKTFREIFRDSVRHKIDGMLINRRGLLGALTVPAMQLYNFMFTEDELRAIDVLSSRGNLLRMGQLFYIEDIPEEHALPLKFDHLTSVRAKVTLPEPKPLIYNQSLSFAALPPDVAAGVADWVSRYSHAEHERKLVLHRLDMVGSKCGTWGQVLRVWPELRSFLDAGAAATANRAKARSAYPAHMNIYDNQYIHDVEIHPQWLPEAFTEVNTLLAECLMLPEMTPEHRAEVCG